MITIKYPTTHKSMANSWQTRLDALYVKYLFVEDDSLTEPLLIEGAQQAAGVP